MKYSITLVKITKNVSGPVSINFVSLASEPSLLVLRHDRCFGTIVASARSLLRHDRCFGTSVASARALLRHDRCFGTNVSSPAGKYEALSNASQREVNKASGTSLLGPDPRQTSLLSWSQIFPQVGKRAFRSADNEDLLES